MFLGPATKLLTSTYEINGLYGNEFLPEGTRGFQYGDITIKDDAYIGANSVIMPGVTIGEGAVVGANSLVDRNLKPWGIYFGNPVKLIGMREQPSNDKKRIIESMDWTKHF
ncbi:MAG: acyltransferase [Paludibacteraceae bacterium]|nr:acyltransferase [Paludibacteraceae bacterium]